MQRSYRNLVLTAAAAATVLLLAGGQGSAQEATKQKQIVPPGAAPPKPLGPRGPSGPVPRTSDGKPDFSGLWNSQRNLPGQEEPAMLPWAAALTKERTANYSADDPEARCIPGGVPRAFPYHHQIVQTSKLMLVLFEGNIHTFRQIFLDRTEHPKNVGPLWYGDSIAKWEGDTLVVDSVGFNDQFWFDMAGHPHSTELHVIERYHRRDFGNLEIEVTVIDPKTYSKPWVMKREATLETEIEMTEYVCNENNSDALHLVGK
ncbi:MAG: hypothetical protein ABI811_14295 [Acidobacteriota bacterium]